MALVKIFALPKKHDGVKSHVARSVKLVCAAALNVENMPTNPGTIETVLVEGIDLVGIDYILEVIAVKRPNQQRIAENIIDGLNRIYPDTFFSVYFNNIQEAGMANTQRESESMKPITMDEAIERSKL